jgi:hypothetical protein
MAVVAIVGDVVANATSVNRIEGGVVRVENGVIAAEVGAAGGREVWSDRQRTWSRSWRAWVESVETEGETRLVWSERMEASGG